MKTKTRVERNKAIIFYVSDDEKKEIVEFAKGYDLTISDYCRKILTGKEIEKDV